MPGMLAVCAAVLLSLSGSQGALFDELEELYPDSSLAAGVQALATHTTRGAYAGVHVLLTGLDSGEELSFDIEHADRSLGVPTFYRLIDVPVEENTGLGSRTEQFEGKENPHVIRRAPFRVFEALQPLVGPFLPPTDVIALRAELFVPRTAGVGKRELEVVVRQGERELRFAWTLVVHGTFVPPAGEQTLAYTNWFSPSIIAEKHGLELWSEPFWDMLARYAALMHRGRQNTFWVRWADMFEERELQRERLVRYVETFRASGLFWIEGAPIARRPEGDWSKDWLWLPLADLPATGEEGSAAVAALWGEVWELAGEHGWRETWLQHVSDEPTDVNAADYAKLAGILRAAMPGVKIIEATMCVEVAGAVDVWCPQVQEYQKRRDFFEERRAAGDELWVYTCLVPGGPWLNRLLDQERLRQVYIGWAAAKYDLGGFLHWGFNHYKADPFEQSVVDHPAMPNTTNKLPAGDTHVVYPGPDGPWSSQRFEAHRIGLEDRELLELLKGKDAAAAEELIARVFRAFDDYSTDVAEYRKVKRELLAALDRE